ncbi:hypothetical protein [Paenibacillus elgii]|uniref:hypothetical protein n=1 Tax=Paenibacillus elgii TaxID=189691 RepID=UPI000248D409|nr:hypothetical protein [Paenibacillus elgii]
MKLQNNLVSATGEYLVCSELGQRGILGLLTPKNNPLFDVVATNETGTKTVHLQVKTMSSTNKQGWKLNKSICIKRNNDNLFVVLVRLNGVNEKSNFYIYKYDELADVVAKNYSKYMSTPKRNGLPKTDTDMRWHNFKDFTPEDELRANDWGALGF